MNTPDMNDFIEVKLANPEAFLLVKETLTRIGIASSKEKKLWQSCHILHKRGSYYILGFKELFLLDGKEASITEDDTARRNAIAVLLEEWKLVTIVNPEVIKDKAPISNIKIIPFKEKQNYTLIAKYTVGNRSPS